VRTAIPLRDIVRERQHVFVIAVIPFKRDIDADPVALPGNRNRVGEERGLGAIKISDEGRNPAFII